MARFMKLLNNICRSQAIYRHSRVAAEDLQSSHYSFMLAICRMPGCSQEDLARELCVNKSTAARNVTYLEERGYVSRTPLPQDKRQFSVHPTEKGLQILPQIREASAQWMALLSEGISADELEIFHSVLQRMQDKARQITEQEVIK